MVLSQTAVAACRDAFATHDGDAARLRAMLHAAALEAADETVLELCSQVAVARPLQSLASSGGADPPPSHADSGASFDILLRMVELQARSVEDEAADTVLAYVALGGNPDKSGSVSVARLKAVCKDFGLLVDVDEFLAHHDAQASEDQLEYARFERLLG